MDQHANEKTPVVVTENDDIGLQYIAQHGTTSYTPQEEHRVRWKLDLNLMPIMMITYGLQYLDKVTISYAAVYNMREELGLVGQEYSWSSSIFYVGYLVGQLPSNYLLQRFPIAKFVAVSLLIWGILVMLCAVTKNFAGLATLRFLMGLFESGISPAWTHITAMFYNRQEQGARFTAWFFMVGVAVIVGGLMGYGVGHAHTAVKVWQLVFLVCGGFTVFWGIIVLFFLPDSPTNARFLNERERIIAVERLRENRTGVKNTVFKMAQALEAFRDPQVWAFALITGVAQIVNIGGSFLPLMIQDMGFDQLHTTLLTIPTGGVECIAMILAGLASSSLVQGRTLIIFTISIPTLVGCVFLAAIPRSQIWIRIVGSWLLFAAPAGFALMLSLIGSNVAGFSKKITTTAVTFIMYCVGNIVCPQLFVASEAPGYGTAMRGMLVSMSTLLLLELLLCAYYVWENRRRDRALAETPQSVVDAMTFENEEYADRTDMEDWMKFRYRW